MEADCLSSFFGPVPTLPKRLSSFVFLRFPTLTQWVLWSSPLARPAFARCGRGVLAACAGGCPAGNQVFSRFCLANCNSRSAIPAGQTPSPPAEPSIFPVLSRPLPVRPPFFFGPGCAVLSVCGLALRLALPQATGSPIGKVNCFGKTALSVPVTALDHGHSGGSLCSMGGREGV